MSGVHCCHNLFLGGDLNKVPSSSQHHNNKRRHDSTEVPSGEQMNLMGFLIDHKGRVTGVWVLLLLKARKSSLNGMMPSHSHIDGGLPSLVFPSL